MICGVLFIIGLLTGCYEIIFFIHLFDYFEHICSVAFCCFWTIFCCCCCCCCCLLSRFVLYLKLSTPRKHGLCPLSWVSRSYILLVHLIMPCCFCIIIVIIIICDWCMSGWRWFVVRCCCCCLCFKLSIVCLCCCSPYVQRRSLSKNVTIILTGMHHILSGGLLTPYFARHCWRE